MTTPAASSSGSPNGPAGRPPVARTHPRRDIAVALACGAFVGLMVGAAFAAVPLYTWFCRVTGFGGTPQVASVAPGEVLDRKITVRFDANIGRGLPWRFAPEAASVDVKLGEVVTVYYTVTNQAARETSGTAAYNVTPAQTGAYFSKINCFCFTEQRLKAGETREMAVVFFVDPALARDADQNDLNTITLSYTFYPTREPAARAASPPPPPGGGRSGREADREGVKAKLRFLASPHPDSLRLSTLPLQGRVSAN